MDTIKNPQRQMQRLIQPGQFLKVTQHQHTHWIPPRHPLHKPANGSLPCADLLGEFHQSELARKSEFLYQMTISQTAENLTI
jgi:hypothetical protein